jgi:hypothetical protein
MVVWKKSEGFSISKSEDPIELMLWYWELSKKRKNGTFTSADAIDNIYICIELSKAGYIPNDNKSDWIPPVNSDQRSN